MSQIPERLPDAGVYQSFRYDTALQLGAVATIAHANLIEYCAKQGIDHGYIKPRQLFGFTPTSRRDMGLATGQLLADHFDVGAFAEEAATIPSVETGPIPVSNAFCTNRYAGFRLNKADMGKLADRWARVRLAANNAGGLALPVRQEFDHVSLLWCDSRRAPLPVPKRKIREIITAAKEEVGLEELYLGKLMLGANIGKPLPDEAFGI